MTPEQLFRICRTAPYSPCRSLMKCSVPLGRVRIAFRFMISEQTAASFGYFSAKSSRYSRVKSPIVRSLLYIYAMVSPRWKGYNAFSVNMKKIFQYPNIPLSRTERLTALTMPCMSIAAQMLPLLS